MVTKAIRAAIPAAMKRQQLIVISRVRTWVIYVPIKGGGNAKLVAGCQLLNIIQILMTPCRFFCLDQIVQMYKSDH